MKLSNLQKQQLFFVTIYNSISKETIAFSPYNALMPRFYNKSSAAVIKTKLEKRFHDSYNKFNKTNPYIVNIIPVELKI